MRIKICYFLFKRSLSLLKLLFVILQYVYLVSVYVFQVVYILIVSQVGNPVQGKYPMNGLQRKIKVFKLQDELQLFKCVIVKYILTS